VVAYGGGGDKLPFKATNVLDPGPPEQQGDAHPVRLRRGDCVEYRVEVCGGGGGHRLLVGLWGVVFGGFGLRAHRRERRPCRQSLWPHGDSA
jgi:hypothetical protein